MIIYQIIKKFCGAYQLIFLSYKALLLALASPDKIKVEALTIVFGNNAGKTVITPQMNIIKF